jgi:pimeloyl-ACP methyl ester carboxylesterase
LKLEEWKEKGLVRTVLGREIFYLDTPCNGDVEGTIFLIHGFPSASWDWHRIWPALNQRYRLIAPDLLGFGLSEKPLGHDYHIHEQADFCEQLLEELGVDECRLLAHDYGDTVAQELLARQNEGSGKVIWQSCMLLNGGLFPETHRPLLVQKLLLSPLGFLFRGILNRRTLEKAFDRILGPDTKVSHEEMDTLWALFSYRQGQRNTHRLIHYMSDRIEHRERWVAALQHARCPLGLINGSLDPVSGEHMVERFITLIGDNHFIKRLSNIGHYPQLEAPEAVASACLQFFSQAHLAVAGGNNGR